MKSLIEFFKALFSALFPVVIFLVALLAFMFIVRACSGPREPTEEELEIMSESYCGGYEEGYRDGYNDAKAGRASQF